MAVQDFSRISPTAHYTGYVWYRHGMSHPALETRTGKILFHAIEPLMALSRVAGGHAIEDLLLARHRSIDYLLSRAIDSGVVGQVVEIAAGLSPRGMHMVRRFRHRDLVYVEGDLPHMAAYKRERLASMDLIKPNHHVVALNALERAGGTSLEEVASHFLDPDVGTAVITEGLVNYFEREDVEQLWARIAAWLRDYPSGVYLSDLHTRDDVGNVPGSRAFRVALSAFTRGRVHLHFQDAREGEAAFAKAGFARATAWSMEELAEQVGLDVSQSATPVRVTEAWTVQRR